MLPEKKSCFYFCLEVTDQETLGFHSGFFKRFHLPLPGKEDESPDLLAVEGLHELPEIPVHSSNCTVSTPAPLTVKVEFFIKIFCMTGIYQIKDPALSVDSFYYLIQDIFPEFDIDIETEGFPGEREDIGIRIMDDYPDLNGDLHALAGAVDSRKFHVDIGGTGGHRCPKVVGSIRHWADNDYYAGDL
jgi:hypothetical protein